MSYRLRGNTVYTRQGHKDRLRSSVKKAEIYQDPRVTQSKQARVTKIVFALLFKKDL
jgi:hypothetical protein